TYSFRVAAQTPSSKATLCWKTSTRDRPSTMCCPIRRLALTGACRKNKSVNRRRFLVVGSATVCHRNLTGKCCSWPTAPPSWLLLAKTARVDVLRLYRTHHRYSIATTGQP